MSWTYLPALQPPRLTDCQTEELSCPRTDKLRKLLNQEHDNCRNITS